MGYGAVSVRIEAIFAPGQQNFLPEGFPFEDDFSGVLPALYSSNANRKFFQG